MAKKKEKVYYLKNPSGVVISADKETADRLLAAGGFEQVTDKAIISKVGKVSQSRADGTTLGQPWQAPKLVEVDEMEDEEEASEEEASEEEASEEEASE